MAFEIVDGMTGTKHISSDDLAALNTATVGKANCVLEYGNDFALAMASANTATLGTGVGMVGGKRFWNQAATSLTIQSGTQGQKRNDLVVARYAKTSAGIESITPVVIKGTPTTGNPADPNTTANDLKLWRVPLDGINAGTPVRLFEPVTPLATLGDSVSQGGEQPFPGGYLFSFGPLRVLQIQNMTIQAGAVRNVGKLPVKPTREVVGAISYGSAAGYVSVHADGTVYCTSKASGDFSGQVCFVA
ncbi:hypothetical protein [Parolsenella catena]|uniref:hypothetical protein n=1 Tax=Parolsenella catena TaxID=2003188 RepID=UPI003077297F